MEDIIRKEAKVIIEDGSEVIVKVGDLIKDAHTNEYHEVESIYSVYNTNFEQVFLFMCRFDGNSQRAVKPEQIIAIEKK